jgi:pyrroline-5-carboxylate reductase
MAKIGFIGAGNMAAALVAAMHGHSILVSDRIKARAKKLPCKVARDNVTLVRGSAIIFLCVKPQDVGRVLEEIKEVVGQKIIVSIAAGISIAAIQSAVQGAKVIRVMPNTPALVGEMAAGYAVGLGVSKKEAELVGRILGVAGMAIEVKESQLNAVTGLSGSGPAFFAYLYNAFITAGKQVGLSAETARQLTLQTAIGTAVLLGESRMSASALIKKVSSPNGTKIAGRKILEKSGVNKIISRTVSAAVKRSIELR